jgi:anti-sigma regulatory factor (Ser/Thr protein kinase)
MKTGDAPSRLRLLVVEEAESISGELAQFIEETALDPIRTSSSEEALRLLKEYGRELLVIADLDLPGMVESDFLGWIGNSNVHARSVLLGTQDRTKILTERYGFSKFEIISKPIANKDVVASIRRSLLLRESRVHNVPHIGNLVSASFEFVFRTDEISPSDLARFLGGMLLASRFCDEEAMAKIEIAAYEAMVNAVEHGNLALQSTLKSDLLETDDRFAILRTSRILNEQYGSRNIRVKWTLVPEKLEFTVEDEGTGFDHASVLCRIRNEPDPEHLLACHGRGMMLIVNGADEVRFNSSGNAVTLVKYGPNRSTAPSQS